MATANFETSLGEILRHEGGYVDHPSDPGGATNMGITRKTLARWRRVSPWWELPKSDVKALERTEASKIYKKLYWTPVAGNALPAGLDLALFDYAVNSGPARAVKTLQKTLKVRRDGVPGPITLGAVRAFIQSHGIAALINALCARRMGFLRSLSTFTVFGRGWTSRVSSVRKSALALAGANPKSPTTTWRPEMNILDGYKTYIMGALMLAAGVAQLAGLDVPGFDGQSAGQLIFEGLAIVFLRKGLKSDLSNV